MDKTKMQAAVITRYGPPEVVEIQEQIKPAAEDKEILIKVHAATVTSGDNRLRKADPFIIRLFYGLLKPKINILGSEIAGVVEAAGKDVKHFKTGDQVFGYSGTSLGTHAEYTVFPESGTIVKKPAGMSYEQAASIPFGGITALYFLKEKGDIRKGQKVLVYGASGAVGSSAVQLAKYFGTEVTGVCSTSNLGLVKSLGADIVIDYTREDLSEKTGSYDIIFDAVGKISLPYRKLLAPDGKFVSIKKGIAKGKKEDLMFLKDLIEEGKLNALIDRQYPMEQIRDAFSYVDKGHKKGSVVITVAPKN